MKHIVILRHTAVTIKDDSYHTIEHDYEFDDFSTAFQHYQDKVKEYSEHICTLSATRLETSIKMVSKRNDGTIDCHCKISMNN